MHQRKTKNILVYFFLLLIISSINSISFKNSKFGEIHNIEVSGLSNHENKSIVNEIKNIHLGNIFFINEDEIINLINSNSLIENYEVKKNYPGSIEFKLDKTEFLAKINKYGKTLIIGSNGKLLSNEHKNLSLPFIFGNPNISEFLSFKKILDQSKFSPYEIQNFYFFPSKRWDLKLKNNILIKLSNRPTLNYLNNLYEFLENYSSGKVNVVDARINNQIIINEQRY